MRRGGTVVNPCSREELLKVIRNARSKVEEIYRSDSAIIKRVVVRTGGSYFLVVESDTTTTRDEMAMARLTGALGASWRNRIVETDFCDRRHPELLWSSSFSIHVVHPDCPPGEPIRSTLV
jgi:hypothetical protein